MSTEIEKIMLPITFYTQYVEEEKVWYAHSSLSILNGVGDTKEDAIENHIDYFNSIGKQAEEKYNKLMSKNPRMTIKKYILKPIDEQRYNLERCHRQ